jgi:2-succinyl-6-hydroxy-2,4-cyclohexadiene-1-carboxylate synthase
LSYIEINGLDYYYQVQGSGSPLLLLHGFACSSANWQDTLNSFTNRFQVVLIDLPGHGRTASPSGSERYTMENVSHDIITISKALHLSSVNLLGYSMGGRLALYIATRHPTFVRSLIIESASPGLETTTQRNMRIESDNHLADQIEVTGVPSFVEQWQQLPLFATQRGLSAKRQESLRQQRLNNSASGLANSLRSMGTGQQPSLWPELEMIHLPVLIMAGELDGKFVSIAQQMAAAMPQAELKIIGDSGHNVHLEKIHLFTSTVLDFLAELKEAVPN